MRNMRTNEPLQQYIMMLYLRVTAARRNRNTVMVFFVIGFIVILGDYFFADPNFERRFILFLVELLLGLSLVYSSVYLRIIESFQELTEVLERQGITPERKRLPDHPGRVAITRPRDKAEEG
jgi:hypothetical protein